MTLGHYNVNYLDTSNCVYPGYNYFFLILVWQTDLMSSELDQIFKSVHNKEVFVFIIVPNITGVQPAFRVNHLV